MKTEFIGYEVDGPVGVITLDRPQAANAQSMDMLDDIDEAWSRAAADPEVRVIVVRANGRHFSAGHDLRGGSGPIPDPITLEYIYEIEAEKYLGYCLRWRDIPKPSIAAVQGKCIAGGLMLCWPCDLIVAAEDAAFSDPVVAMGIAGVEYHAHTWELGARKAKEILFTGRPLSADEARDIGMVNKVVPREDLDTEVMALAQRIAQFHPFALRQAKRAVNQTLDVQGFHAAVQAVFDVHQTGHGHALSATGFPVLVRLEEMKQQISRADNGASG